MLKENNRFVLFRFRIQSMIELGKAAENYPTVPTHKKRGRKMDMCIKDIKPVSESFQKQKRKCESGAFERQGNRHFRHI